MASLIATLQLIAKSIWSRAPRLLPTALVCCGLFLALGWTNTGTASTTIAPTSQQGPANLPSDLESTCVSAYETPAVETFLQGWSRSNFKLYNCNGVAIASRQAGVVLASLPLRGTVKLEAVNWDKGLYAIRVRGQLYFVNEDDAIRVGLEPRHIPPITGQSRGVEAPPATAPIGGPPPQDNRIHEVQVFYGTDRSRLSQTTNGVLLSYLAARGPVSYGTATVTLPPRHERGSLERPSWWRFELVADPAKHVTFKGAVPAQSREAFLADVRSVVAASTEKQAFVFVHGFNTNFEEAALRTAQMHHDLGFDGAPIFWSWASKGRANPMAYFADARAAGQTVDELSKFLTLIAQETGATRVHIIAHSMGNQATIRALDQIAAQTSTTRALFDQVVLCSPDVDRAEFERIASRIQSTSRRTTLYTSSNDRALQVSAILNKSGPRLGDATSGVVTRMGLESIDASKVTTDLFSLNHTFFSSVPSVIGDLHAVLTTPAEPSQRGLLEVRTSNQSMASWAIP
jgi:esterase/lipase superfamily enzyme